MEEIHSLRWYIEDRVNVKAVEGLDDISLAICFLKPTTPVLPKWVGNLEGTYFLVKIFLEIFLLLFFLFSTTQCAHRYRDYRAE